MLTKTDPWELDHWIVSSHVWCHGNSLKVGQRCRWRRLSHCGGFWSGEKNLRKPSSSSFPACQWPGRPLGWEIWGRMQRSWKKLSQSLCSRIQRGAQWHSMMAGMLKEVQDYLGPTERSTLKENNCQGMLRWQIIWNMFCHFMVDIQSLYWIALIDISVFLVFFWGITNKVNMWRQTNDNPSECLMKTAVST